jgi:hypothetical protein
MRWGPAMRLVNNSRLSFVPFAYDILWPFEIRKVPQAKVCSNLTSDY